MWFFAIPEDKESACHYVSYSARCSDETYKVHFGRASFASPARTCCWAAGVPGSYWLLYKEQHASQTAAFVLNTHFTCHELNDILFVPIKNSKGIMADGSRTIAFSTKCLPITIKPHITKYL